MEKPKQKKHPPHHSKCSLFNPHPSHRNFQESAQTNTPASSHAPSPSLSNANQIEPYSPNNFRHHEPREFSPEKLTDALPAQISQGTQPFQQSTHTSNSSSPWLEIRRQRRLITHHPLRCRMLKRQSRRMQPKTRNRITLRTILLVTRNRMINIRKLNTNLKIGRASCRERG